MAFMARINCLRLQLSFHWTSPTRKSLELCAPEQSTRAGESKTIWGFYFETTVGSYRWFHYSVAPLPGLLPA